MTDCIVCKTKDATHTVRMFVCQECFNEMKSAKNMLVTDLQID
jgi:hypothetical protein